MIPLERSPGRIRRIPVDTGQLQRPGVRPGYMERFPCQIDRVIRGDPVQFNRSSVTIIPFIMIPAVPQDPLPGRRDQHFLFDLLLSPVKNRRIFIIDATRIQGLDVGELAELDLSQIDGDKTNDFSVHHFPSLNLLEELNSREEVQVRVLAVKADQLPDQVRPGLSGAVEAAVPRACEWIMERISK